jgi:hypothetical protein
MAMIMKPIGILAFAMLCNTTAVFAQPLVPFALPTLSMADGNPTLASREGYINSAGDVVVPPVFYNADHFSPFGLARVQNGGKWGFANAEGKLVIAPTFDAVFNFSTLGLAWAKLGGLYGVINPKGEWVIAPAWPDVQAMHVVDQRWYAPVNTAGGWRVFNGAGFASDASYADVLPISPNGLLPVMAGGRWGFVNLPGAVVVAPRYERISWNVSKSGRFAAQLDGKWGVADLTGKTIVPFMYKDVSWFFGPDEEMLVETKATGEAENFMYLRKDGTQLFKEKFDSAADFGEDGVAIAKRGATVYRLTTRATLTRLGEFDDFDATTLPGVFRYRKDNGCPMYVDQDLKPLPGWARFIGKVKAASAELAKTVPLVRALGCVYSQ